MRAWIWMVLVGVALVLPSGSYGTVWYVHPNPDSGQASTIQEGTDLASPGDTVLVASGTYHDCTHVGFDGSLNCVMIKSGVTLRSATGRASCVTIDAQRDFLNPGRVLYCDGADNTTRIEGFTITGGYLTDKHGGGVYCVDSAPVFANCTFSVNHAHHGGGLHADSCSLELVDCLFSANVADSASGGGVWCHGGSLTLTGCEFSENSAAQGGGICSEATSLAVVGCIFTDNSSDEGGGGWLCHGSSIESIPASFDECVFSGNQANLVSTSSGGGALEIEYISPTLTGCTFTGNVARKGGAIICTMSSPVFDWCTFGDNHAITQDPQESTPRGWSPGGGAVFSWSSCSLCLTLPEFTGCTFYGNSAEESGGALLSLDHSEPTVTGCTFYGNSAPNGGGGVFSSGEYSNITLENTIVSFGAQGEGIACERTGAVTLTCCDVYGNAGGDWVGCIADQYGMDGNISEDPKFCEPDSNDFTIRDTSPCAPANSPPGCGRIGADSVGCYVGAVATVDAHFPGTLALGPAIPNPFNPVTELRYEIPAGSKPSRVVLSLYDARGRKVHTLIDAHREPGSYTVTWDGRDHRGMAAASGVYFCRLSWQGKSETTRLVLLK
jgi:predicted outer membrane repeat protein